MKVINSSQFTTFISQNNQTTDTNEQIYVSVKDILNKVKKKGDQAVKEAVKQFDGAELTSFEVSEEERKSAWNHVKPEVIESLKIAAANIKAFHRKQLPVSRTMETSNHVISGQLFRPIEKVGIYVPGGTAVYPSSVLMNCIPAVIAGVNEVIMVTPVRFNQPISPVLSVAADIAGVHKIYKVGGVQAIAALTYGTETIPAVDKIVGPGNAYVAAAKQLVYGQVGIDMIAGPSEVAIIADEYSNPAYIAADLIAQAEHDPLARTVLFTHDAAIIEATQGELVTQLETLPRKEIAKQALENCSALVLTNSLDESFELSNLFAPEHLEIQVENPLQYLGKIKHAGAIFLGKYTPVPVGDYAAGPNHVLPTSGTARFSSGLSVDDFFTKSTYVYYDEMQLQQIGPHVSILAAEEQLEGHARAVDIRIKEQKG